MSKIIGPRPLLQIGTIIRIGLAINNRFYWLLATNWKKVANLLFSIICMTTLSLPDVHCLMEVSTMFLYLPILRFYLVRQSCFRATMYILLYKLKNYLLGVGSWSKLYTSRTMTRTQASLFIVVNIIQKYQIVKPLIAKFKCFRNSWTFN